MKKQTWLWIAVGLFVLFLISFGMAVHLASLPPTMSAADGQPETFTFAGLWSLIATGAFVPMVLSFIKSHQTQINNAGTVIKNIGQTIGGDKTATMIEAVSAAVAYASNRDDPTARSRFIHAELAEVRDILLMANPAIATPLNALMIAITNAQFPVKTIGEDSGVVTVSQSVLK